jgi:hypothetical protein
VALPHAPGATRSAHANGDPELGERHARTRHVQRPPDSPAPVTPIALNTSPPVDHAAPTRARDVSADRHVNGSNVRPRSDATSRLHDSGRATAPPRSCHNTPESKPRPP